MVASREPQDSHEPSSNALSSLTPSGVTTEAEILALFADLGRELGMPKSLGAIYGFLFISSGPVTFEDIVQNVLLSTGSVSQGLRVLKSIGAAQLSRVPGSRRDHYVAETRLRHLLLGLLQSNLAKFIRGAEGRLGRIQALIAENEQSSSTVRDRVRTLESWHTQASVVVPAMLEVLTQPRDSA